MNRMNVLGGDNPLFFSFQSASIRLRKKQKTYHLHPTGNHLIQGTEAVERFISKRCRGFEGLSGFKTGLAGRPAWMISDADPGNFPIPHVLFFLHLVKNSDAISGFRLPVRALRRYHRKWHKSCLLLSYFHRSQKVNTERGAE